MVGRRVLLTGASGLIGTALQSALHAAGATPLVASRNSASGLGSIVWQPESSAPFPDAAALEGLDAAIHLSGANVSTHRWTRAYKQEIVSSRTVTTGALARALEGLRQPPRVLISASAIGIYGDRGDKVLDESAPPGAGFLAETCVAWEAATAPATRLRVVHLRLGVVLAPVGGALAKMLPLFRLGLGGRLGNGRAWMSWITLPDVVSTVLHLLASPDAAGPYNCVAPAPVTNAEFTHALAAAVHRPAILPAPGFALRVAFGQMADEALLASCRAVPARLLASGFSFAQPQVSPALASLLQR